MQDVTGRPGDDGGPRRHPYRSGDSTFSLYPTEFAGPAQHTLAAFTVRDLEAGTIRGTLDMTVVPENA